MTAIESTRGVVALGESLQLIAAERPNYVYIYVLKATTKPSFRKKNLEHMRMSMHMVDFKAGPGR